MTSLIMPTRKITALVVPTDGGDPSATIEAIGSALRDHPEDHTILVVSPEDVADDAAGVETAGDKEVGEIHLVWEQHPALYPLRLIAGWRLAAEQKSDLIFTTDDSWHPSPAEVNKFLDIYESGARIVAGRRPETSRLENLCRKWTKFKSRSNLTDPSSPIRLYDRKALKTILRNLSINTPLPQSKPRSPAPRKTSCQTAHPLLARTIPALERQSGFATKETPATC